MQHATEKAKHIKLLILDVDGVLTTGALYYNHQGEHFKPFHVHDGLGMKLLQKAGIEIAVISAKDNAAVVLRLQELGVKHAYLGHENKLPAYEELKTKLKLQDNEIAYAGDDLPDLPLLKRAGLAITVPAAAEIIKQHTDYITTKKSGKGAVRELCEFILKAQNKYDAAVAPYLI